nr:hypothetical protein [Hathewaya massiliensis]
MFGSEQKENESMLYMDDKISHKNRTKFFDFIIPVLQVANSSNTCEILLNKFKKTNELKGIKEDLITDLTYLINDMRVIKNIYNEFIIYKNNLEINEKLDLNEESKKNKKENESKQEEGDKKSSKEETKNNKDEKKWDSEFYEKLLAIIVYKNLYPVDFSKLQNDEGMVYEIFNNRHELIKESVDKIEKECVEIKEKIDIAKKEHLHDLEELRIVYNYKLTQKHGTGSMYIHSIGYHVDINRLLDEHNLEHIKKDIDASLLPIIEEYEGRKKILDLKEDTMNELIHKLKEKLYKLNKQKRIINSLPLKEIINNYELGKTKDYKIFKEELLMLFIKKGYIEEDYYEYTSYFYEGTLTTQDRNFLKNIAFEKTTEHSYKLVKYESVLKKLKAYQFEKEYILNYGLVDYIIKNKNGVSQYEEYYKILITQLTNESDSSFNFINQYIDITEYNEIFMKDLCKNWDNMWMYICEKSEAELDDYLRKILKFGDIDDIIKMNKNNVLTNYISDMPGFLNLIEEDNYLDKVKQLIIKLDVKFKYIDKHSYKGELLEFVYNEDRYEINEKNIQLFIEQYSSNVKLLETLETSNYSTIKSSECKELIKYIDQNIDCYVEEVFLVLKSNTKESEEIIVELFNNDDISDENKLKILEKENIKIKSIEKIPRDLWSKALNQSKFEVNWNNIISYYESFEIDETLIKLFNNGGIYKELGKIQVEDFEDDTVYNLGKSLILCDEIEEVYFEVLIKLIEFKESNIKEFINVSKDRMEILINNKCILLNVKNYNLLKKNLLDAHMLLLKNNFEQYLEDKESYKVDLNDIQLLLKLNPVIDDQIICLIENIDIEDISIDEEVLKDISSFIMNHKHLEELDNKLISIVSQYELDKELDKNLLKYIMEISNATENKVQILSSQVKHLNSNKISLFLKQLGQPYANIVNKKTRVTIENSEVNKNLACVLKDNEYIKKLEEDGNNIRLYLNNRNSNKFIR